MCGSNGDCLDACSNDMECVPGFYCNGSKCVEKLVDGKGCTGNNQCGNGHCIDKFCCGSAAWRISTSCGLSAAS